MIRKFCYIFIFIIIFLFYGCSSNTPEYAVNNIISAYNNKDIESFWNNILPDDRYTVSSSLISNINNQDLFYMIAPVLDKDNVSPDNISAEEYIYGSFRIILGDKDMELIKLNKISDSLYYADIKTGEKQIIMPLKYFNGSWYMSIKK